MGWTKRATRWRLGRSIRTSRDAPPIITAITAPTRPGSLLLQGESFTITGTQLGGMLAVVYWADSTVYGAATKTSCKVTAGTNESLTGTMCNPAFVGTTGYFFVVRPGGGVSAASSVQNCLPLVKKWTFGTALSRPDNEITSSATITYTTDNGNDIARVAALAFDRYAYGTCNDLSPELAEVFVRVEEKLNAISAQDATAVLTAGIAAADDTQRAIFEFFDGDTATPDVRSKVKNSAAAYVPGTLVPVTQTAYNTLEMHWKNVAGTVTFYGWVNGTVSSNGTVCADMGTAAIGWVCCGARYCLGNTFGGFDQKSLKMWGK